MDKQSVQPLTEKQVALLKNTFKQIVTDRLAMRFYSTLFVKHPEVKAVFPSDLTDLATKLVSVFHLVVYSFKETRKDQYLLQHELLRPLRNLGELHAKKGVIEKYYPWANEILIESIREELADKFSPEIDRAWRLALDHLTTAMTSENIPVEPHPQHKSMRDSFNFIKSLLFKK
jgi:hemoglobin-like flavoprotein